MTWHGLQESMWNAFGRLDSLLPDDEYKGKQFVADDEPLCLDPLFLQRATRKARNYFYLYLQYPGNSAHDIPALRVLLKLKRQHRCAPMLGYDTSADKVFGPALKVTEKK